MHQIRCFRLPHPEGLQGWRGDWWLWWSQNFRYLSLKLFHPYPTGLSRLKCCRTCINTCSPFVFCLSSSVPAALCRWDCQLLQEAGWPSFCGAQGWGRLSQVYWRWRRKCCWWATAWTSVTVVFVMFSSVTCIVMWLWGPEHEACDLK